MFDEESEKVTNKRSLSTSDYNLVFQEVVPVNITKRVNSRRKVLKKLPLRFQEVVEVTTKPPDVKLIGMKSTNQILKPFVHLDNNEVSDVQEVNEIKRYSLQELENKFPQIFKINNRVDTELQETFEISKLKTKYTPAGEKLKNVRPVYFDNLRNLEISANNKVLREVNLGSEPHDDQVLDRNNVERKESLFDDMSDGEKNDKTQIIITLQNNPEIKLFNSEPKKENVISPPAPPSCKSSSFFTKILK